MRSFGLGPLVFCALASSLTLALYGQVSPNQASANEGASWLTPSSELNTHLPYWLRFSGEERVRGEGDLGIGFGSGTDRYLLNRLRLNMQLLPVKWLKFNFQSQDARAFWRQEAQKTPYRDTWDLRQAYVEVGDLERYHAAVRIGRQELTFGDERLVGVSNWTNAARSYDGYRASFGYKRVHLDAFAASVVVIPTDNVGYHVPGNYIEGLYGDVSGWLPGATIQPYFLWRRSPGLKLGNGTVGTEDFGTTGVRWVGKLPGGFSYNTETAIQRGSLKTDKVSAWATHLQLNYQLPFQSAVQTTYIAEFNYASGDGNSKDAVHHTFDTLYASGHDKIEFADQVGWKNIREVRSGFDLKLGRKTKLMTRYADLWLANAHDSLYASNGAAAVSLLNGTAGRWVGQEFDGTFTYAVTKTSQLGGGYGYLLPGTFLQKAARGHFFGYPFLFYQTSF